MPGRGATDRADLNRHWHRLGGAAAAGRADFRHDPDFVGALSGWSARLLARLPTRFALRLSRLDLVNLYRWLRPHLPDLDARIAALITDPALRALLDAATPGAAELACELIALGTPVDAAVSDFSGAHYLALYPDVAAAGMRPLAHYILYGRAEGRRFLGDLRRAIHRGAQGYDPARPTCLICLHTLSATGAPGAGLALARAAAAASHNVLLVAGADGPLADAAIAAGCALVVTQHLDAELAFLPQDLFGRIDMAVLNTVEAWEFARPLVLRDIPFAAWLHEYPHTSAPGHKALFAALFPDVLVFSSETQRAAWRVITDPLDIDPATDTIVVAQDTLTPRPVTAGVHSAARARIGGLIGQDLTGSAGDKRRIVYGAGLAQWRKGTDMFAMTAAIARERDPDTVFIWIGAGVNHADAYFGTFLEQHLRAQGTGGAAANLFLLPEGAAYADLCHAADALFLASRLDPLPGVVFDAVRAGCAVVLFAGASGFDDAGYDGLIRVPYGDLPAAAAALLAVPAKTLGDAGPRPLPPDIFAPIAAALQARRAMRPARPLALDTYDVPVLSGDPAGRRAERAHLRRLGRRFVWESAVAAQDQIAASDSWLHADMQVRPYGRRDASAPVPPFNLHLHAHYTDGLAADLHHYRAWRQAARIVVTTDQQHKAVRIGALLADAGLQGDIRVVPNRGRDIAPFLDLLRDAGDPDAIWCHLHHKKAPGTSANGDVWRAFLMTILLGDDGAMSEAVDAIARPGVGLVAAFDPYDTGWAGAGRLLYGADATGREGLAGLLGAHLPGPLPRQPLLFPTGQMFWTRAGVAQKMGALFGADHPWPGEPVADDGTVLHAIERLWPAVSASLGLGTVFVDKPDQRRV